MIVAKGVVDEALEDDVQARGSGLEHAKGDGELGEAVLLVCGHAPGAERGTQVTAS